MPIYSGSILVVRHVQHIARVLCLQPTHTRYALIVQQAQLCIEFAEKKNNKNRKLWIKNCCQIPNKHSALNSRFYYIAIVCSILRPRSAMCTHCMPLNLQTHNVNIFCSGYPIGITPISQSTLENQLETKTATIRVYVFMDAREQRTTHAESSEWEYKRK